MAGPAGDDPAARPAAARVPAGAREELAQRARARARSSSRRPRRARAHARRASARSHETNPMLGTRGVRLGILQPEIYDDAGRGDRARGRAVRERTGEPPHVEIMIPLVAYEQRARAHARARRAGRAPTRARRPLELLDRHDDRAAARLLRRRPDRRATPTSSPSAPTTSPRPRSASRATTSRAASWPATST